MDRDRQLPAPMLINPRICTLKARAVHADKCITPTTALRDPMFDDCRQNRSTERRLQATGPMSGTLRVTRVPYEAGDDKYDEAVALFDQYSGSYPTKASLRVRSVVMALVNGIDTWLCIFSIITFLESLLGIGLVWQLTLTYRALHISTFVGGQDEKCRELRWG